MPLYVHPSSTCDICLDPFSIRGQNADSDASKTPHTISCGHIFCRSCLLNILPFTDGGYPSCPHCRKPYRRDKIKALFVALDPENDRPTPGGVLDAIRRADAAASKIRRAENEILPHDLMQSLESVHNFIQAHPSLNLPIEQLVDAFATAMDKYADKSRTLSDYEYRNRRHTLEDQEENSRKEALEESYLDEIQALQNEFRKLGLPMNNIHLPVPPEARKRPSEVRDHAPTNAATSINSSSTQSLLFSSRDEVQRRVQIRADLRRQRPESDRPPRGDVIESGNALGLDGQDDSNRPARRPETQIAGRLLFEGRIVNREEDSTETAPEASLLGVDRREPHYGSVDDETISLPRRPIPQNGEMGPPLSRPMRRASTGASHLLAHGSNQIVAEHRRDISDPSRERQRERHVHTNHHQQGAVHYDGRSPDGSSRQRSSSRHVQYDLPSVIPQIPDSVIPSIQRARSRSPASADIASRHPEPTQNIMSDSRAGRSRAPSMNRSVSLQPPVVESEYETPRISAPVTPGSSVHPTPYNSSPLPLHPSPNVAPYVSIPVPDPSRSYDSPYPIPPPLSRTADQTPHQPIRSYTDGRSRSGTGDLLNPPPLWDPAGLAPIPVPHVHPAATARIPQPPPVPVSAPPLRRNDTLLF